jgi:hypothetical protein
MSARTALSAMKKKTKPALTVVRGGRGGAMHRIEAHK